MKKAIFFTAVLLTGAIVIVSCGAGKNEPGRVYMPDMAYSRATEAYAEKDSANWTMDVSKVGGNMIFYNAMPVKGTIKRGDLAPYTVSSDTTDYARRSAMVMNPIVESLNPADKAEAGRLYNINCAICHGTTGAGNGPIADKIGAVANLTGPQYVAMADGTMFHSITYGKNNMGSYASQLTRLQRWQIVKYIRTLQPKPAGTTAGTAGPNATGAAPTASGGTAPAKTTTDTTKKMM